MDKKLIGVWTLTSLEVGDLSGRMQAVPYRGQIIFTADGHMAVQTRNGDPLAPDTPLTLQGYEAQYGRVVTDEAAGTLSFSIESALVRDLIGRVLERRYEIAGDRFVLLPADPSEGFRVTFAREVSHS